MKGKHDLATATAVANKVAVVLEPYCEKIAICGSIRRQRLVVGDVDIVCAVRDKDGLVNALQQLGSQPGGKMLEFGLVVDGISVDVSVVELETWGASLCHVTGPAGENVRLRAIAKRKGWQLSEYGLRERVEQKGERGRLIAGETEESVYEALGEPYVEPEDRDSTALPIRK